jgi:hypothetical protein
MPWPSSGRRWTMADERDPEVSQRYRELGAEEPPRRLDDAILAASRRRWRWGAPLAAAAVIVLSVALTWHMRVEEPDPYGYTASAPEEQKAKQEAVDQPRLSQRRDALAERRDVPGARPAAPPPEVAASRMEERVPEERMRRAAPMADARAPQADALFSKQLAEEPPEKVLERIAELRKQGKHEEADKALEAFRKRYPDTKLPDSVLRK